MAGALLLVPAACGRQEPAPHKPVVLWRSTPAGPEFPLPREARWAPTYQRLRCAFEERTESGYRWTCFSSGSFDHVLRFYAGKLGVRPGSVAVDHRPAAEYFDRVQSMATELGHKVPGSPRPRGSVRIVQLWPARGLPLVRLESPWLDLDTGRVHRGTLISMRWQARTEEP